MDSQPQVEEQALQEQANTLEGMTFDLDDQLLKVQKSDIDHDQELLQIQRRKSTPKVVIEEYVQMDTENDEEA